MTIGCIKRGQRRKSLFEYLHPYNKLCSNIISLVCIFNDMQLYLYSQIHLIVFSKKQAIGSCLPDPHEDTIVMLAREGYVYIRTYDNIRRLD